LQFPHLPLDLVELAAALTDLALVAALNVTEYAANQAVFEVVNDLFVVEEYKSSSYVEVALLNPRITRDFVLITVDL